MPTKPAVFICADARSRESSGEVRAKPVETKAERRARILAIGERVARDHAEILHALAR